MSRRFSRIQWLLLTAMVCIFIGAAPGHAYAVRTIALSTGSFDFSTAPGGSGKGDLTVINDGDESMDVLVYSANQTVDAKGAVTYTIPNRDSSGFANDPASWISVKIASTTRTIGNTPVISLAPGDRVAVHFTFTVPTTAPPGDHPLLLFFEMLNSDEKTSGATAKVSGRLGARIRIRVPGDLVERMEVRPFSVRNLVLGQKMPWTFLILNEGNIDKSISARLALLDGNENEVWHSDVASDAVVYAGSNLERSGVASGLPTFGHFNARLTLQYPKDGDNARQNVQEQIVKTRSVWIVPIWLAVAVVVLVGLLLMYVSWRQAVKAAVRKSEKAREKEAAAAAVVDQAPVQTE